MRLSSTSMLDSSEQVHRQVADAFAETRRHAAWTLTYKMEVLVPMRGTLRDQAWCACGGCEALRIGSSGSALGRWAWVRLPTNAYATSADCNDAGSATCPSSRVYCR